MTCTNLRQYISSNESLSSTIGIELTRAAKGKDNMKDNTCKSTFCKNMAKRT